MKRSEALAPLSRDHHQTLVVAQKLARIDDQNAAEVIERFAEHWREDAEQHFQIEEAVLLPRFAQFGDAHDPAVLRTLGDHVEIRSCVQRLLGVDQPDLALAASLGKLLAAHVRFEERELYPLIERTMPEDALTELAAAVERAESGQ